MKAQRSYHGVRLAMFIMAAGLAMTACGSDSTPTSEGTEGGNRAVTIGVIPSVAGSPIFVAQSEGLFEEQGLDVELVQIAGGAKIIEAMIGGSIDAGEVGAAPFLLAAAQDVPLVNVITFAEFGTDKSPEHIIVRSDDNLQSVADLKGKRVAVHSFGSLEDIRLRGSVLPSAGLTESDVEVVEVPWPNMGVALEKSQVDAVIPFEPFTTQLLQQTQKFRSIGDLTDTVPAGGLPLDTVVVPRDTWEQDPDLSRKIVAALQEAIRVIDEDPATGARSVADQLKLEMPLVESAIGNFQFRADDDQPMDGYQAFIDIMKQAGLLEAAPELSKYMAQ